MKTKTLSGPYPSDDLLVTKLEVPLVGYRIVPRRRLTEILRAGMQRRLTLLVAPTGYGKTTLLVEWLSGIMLPDWRVIWLTVDSFDNEPFRLWSYIATALKKVYPRLRFDPQRSFQDTVDKSPLEALAPLFNAITQIPYQLVLVLDDYQWITAEHVHEEIRYLLEHQPKNLHLLISSRVAPPFPLSRLRAQRQLVELSARDLSFTLQEARKFFSSAEMDIDQDQAASLLVATEGWIAGLQLVTLSLQGQPDRKSFIASLPEENLQIFEYLTEEVLDQQAPELRDFLLKTSLLSEMSAPLCDAMLQRGDSAEMLNRIQKANLFIVPRDEQRQWYSYHRLFADTLQKYLRAAHADIIPDLHRRACAWLQANGYPEKAVAHALAYGDVEQAARIIDACALQAIIRFDLVQLAQWISRFSDELISKRPQLGVYYALANFLVKGLDKIEPKLVALEQILDRSREIELSAEDETLIRWEIAAIRACMVYWQENSDRSLPDLLALMRCQPESDVYFKGLMLHAVAEVHAFRGDLDASVDAYSKGLQFAIDYGLLKEYCYSMSELPYVRKMQGRLREAEQDYQKMIRYAQRFAGWDDVVAFAKAGLAEIAIDQNRMEQAGELMGWVLENFERVETSPLNWIRQEWLFIRMAMYYLARQDLPNALAFYDKAIGGYRANRQVIHFLLSQLIDLQVKIWAATGALRDKYLNLEAELDDLDPAGRAKPARQIALARCWLARGEPQKALAAILALEPDLRAQNLRERLMEALVIKALAHQPADPKQAFAALEEALQLAAPEGYNRVFIDEGAPMKALLKAYARSLLGADPGTQAALGGLVSSLIAELDQKAPQVAHADEPGPVAGLVQPLAEPFSHRELEILKLILDDKSTKEIAAALSISVNTAKVHIKSIYRKTGAHTRPALLKRVDELGVLKG